MKSPFPERAESFTRPILQGVAVLAIVSATVALVNLYADVRVIKDRLSLIDRAIDSINRKLDAPPGRVGGY